MSDHLCEQNLTFEGTLAAPGFGQSWKCTLCGKPFHRNNASSTPRAYEDLNEEDFILSPADCR